MYMRKYVFRSMEQLEEETVEQCIVRLRQNMETWEFGETRFYR